jgi:O-antigen ligase
MARAALAQRGQGMSQGIPQYVLIAISLLAILVPALALVSAAGGPALLYLAALLSLALLLANSLKHWEANDWSQMKAMIFALSAPLVAMLIANAVNGSWSNSELEKLLRFALVIPVAWALLRAPKSWLSLIQWGVMFGAYSGSAMLVYILWSPDLGRGAVFMYGGRYNAVAFANLTLLFGFASWFTLPFTRSQWPKCEAVLKVMAGVVAIFAVWVSETRSSWGLFAILTLVVLMSNRQWTRHAKVKFAGAAVALMIVAGFALWHAENSRFRELLTDVQRYSEQDRDTSIGIRIQLWTAAWQMFKEHPIAGVGVANFRNELVNFSHQGVVTEKVAQEFGEPHNDFIGAMAGYGILGLLSILALYFVPAVVFLKRLGNESAAIHSWAALGLLFTLGYAQFSLTEMMFRNMRSVPIYAMTLAVLYALSMPKRLKGD